ncbi:MAG: ComEC/Rec2 family competence protein [Elusimicrobiales bacterium]
MKRLAALTVILILGTSAASAQLNVHFINVGQGDATYIELPNGHNVLVDGGPSGQPVLNFLKARGVHTIDHVILTHPHSDHFMGLKTVLRNFQVKNFYDTRVDNTDAQGDNEVREMAARMPGCKTHYPEAGSNLNWDSRVTVKVLNTCSERLSTNKSDEINNCSIVTRFYYNGHGVLLTGDIEAVVENAMTKIFKSGLDSTYLKVSHHGSKSSSAPKFLERVQPRVAIISVGRDNDYGHPHKEAMDRLMAAGAQIYTTLEEDQSLTIPAPRRGVEMMINGRLDIPVSVPQQPEFRMADHTVDPADSAAMRQLMQEASAE